MLHVVRMQTQLFLVYVHNNSDVKYLRKPFSHLIKVMW